MPVPANRNQIIRELKQELLSLQGHRHRPGESINVGLGPIEMAFPQNSFPTGAIHEFISAEPHEGAATNAFIAGIVAKLMNNSGPALWVSTKRTVFPPALRAFGIEPDRIIFIDLKKEKEALWVIEEALKCEAISSVVGEVNELTFIESRKLQLAVEQSRVTGFIHRSKPKSENTVACVTRWKICPLLSTSEDGFPGVGFPQWDVKLLKVRNGKPGRWVVCWRNEAFHFITKVAAPVAHIQTRIAG